MKPNPSDHSSMPPLPDDLRRVLWKRNVLPFLFYLTWLTVLTAVSLFVIYPRIKGSDSMVVAPTVCLAACIIPIFVLKLPYKLRDRTFVGTVRTCKPYTHLCRQIDHLPGEVLYTARAELVIETDRGKLIPMDLPLPDPYAPPPWKAGDRVIHYKGSPFILSADTLHRTCILCGGTSPDDSHQCVFCGHSLIPNDHN